METFSALLALCEGIHRSQVYTPHIGKGRRALMFFLSRPEQSKRRWFETPSRLSWHHCNDLDESKIEFPSNLNSDWNFCSDMWSLHQCCSYPAYRIKSPSIYEMIIEVVFIQSPWLLLRTHWGRLTHICVSKLTIIGSDNGLSPERRQTIIWTDAEILLAGPLGTNFSEILVGIQTFSFRTILLKMSLSGVPDFFDRNKILSGYDLSHYQVPHCIRVFFYFV